MADSEPTTRERPGGIQVQVDEPASSRRRLTITVPPERMARQREREVRRLGRSLRLPGFRKGKVPSRVVEERFGEVVTERVVASISEAALAEAIESERLQPIGEPAFDEIRYQPGEPLTFEVELDVLPPIRLQRTGGFRIDRPEISVTEKEVDELLEQLREERGVWEPVDRAPREGDLVAVRIDRLDEESAAEESGADEVAERAEAEEAGRPYRFELGKGYAIPDVEEAILTLKPDGEDTFEVRFPEDFDDPEMAGATRRLRIRLQEVKERRLPEVDDQFATEVGEFESMAELRSALEEDLRRHKEEEATRTVRDRLLDSVIEANPFEVPSSLVERYLDRVIDAPPDADAERLREARRSLVPAAERQVKRQLVLDRIIEEEGLRATDQELEDRLREAAERRGEPVAALRRELAKEGRLEELRRQLSARKAFEWLEARSTVE